jgi:hypothetical protein
MHLAISRPRKSSALAVLGGCLGAYAVLAIAFHWFIEPSVGKTYAVYAPPPMAVAPPQADPGPAVSPMAARRPALTAFPTAAPNTTGDSSVTKDTPKKQIARTRSNRTVTERRNPFNFVFGSFGGSRRSF